jgi:nucleotide-binding universal stress UspA family protein
MFKSILVAVDGSEASNVAQKLALDLAADQHASVVFVHAVELSKVAASFEPFSGANAGLAIDAAYDDAKVTLKSAEEAANRVRVPCTCKTVEDDCVNAILDTAREAHADLIVVGTHGRGGLVRAVLGSVAEGVARRATVPVLIARTDARHIGT